MADEVKDTELNPLASVLTPQQLAMYRYSLMQNAMEQAGQQNGAGYAARMGGLMAGSSIGQAITARAGDPMMQMANSNLQELQNTAQTPGSAPGQVSPLEAQAQMWDRRAQYFNQTGQVVAAKSMTDQANKLRQQDQQLQTQQAQAYKDMGQGADAFGHLWSTPQEGINPDSRKLQMFQTGPGGLVRWLDAEGKPQVPVASITMKEGQPFINKYADQLGVALGDASQATQTLGMISDLRTRLDQGVITGTSSDTRIALGQALQTAGFTKGGKNNPIANTQAYAAEALQLGMALRPSGTRLTQMEIGWLTKAAGGDTNIPEEGLRAILDASQKIAEGRIGKYNSLADRLQTMAKSKAPDSEVADAAKLYGHMDIPSSDSRAEKKVAAPQATAAPATNGPPQPGWTIHVDAMGRKAWVSPDKKQFQVIQ